MLPVLLAMLLPTTHAETFDWGDDCTSGSGNFAQYIDQSTTEDVGYIPTDKSNVEIALTSATDVDVQLIDVATGTEIIAWPGGLLNGASYDCVTYEDVEYCYSGYNGDQTTTGYGNETITINGNTNRDLQMRAFGYAAGDADVAYDWETTSTCKEVGDGFFTQFIHLNQTETIGDIPSGKANVIIDLETTSGSDVDVQLYSGNTALVQWPNGSLNGPGPQELEWKDVRIVYSGYNGIDGNKGHERIEIWGEVPYDLTMKAYGYAAGTAMVTYSWGEGAGDSCNVWATCDEGLSCKSADTTLPYTGECHTSQWCETVTTAPKDCAGLTLPAGTAGWTCEDYECVGVPALVVPVWPFP